MNKAYSISRSPKIAGLTHVGTIREENEDAISWWTELNGALCFGVLADGMGGHSGGALASGIALDTIQNCVHESLEKLQNRDVELEAVMVAAAQAANTAVQASRDSLQFEKMGTTLVFIAVWNGQMVILHAGDSRCYLLSEGQSQTDHDFIQLTRDDSVVQAMLEEGVITEEDVPNIPYRNRLTNALGIQTPLLYTVSSRELCAGDVLLMCSDGFYQAVEMSEVSTRVLEQGVNQKSVEGLIQLSLDNHTDDNTSVILMRVEDKVAAN